MALTGRGWAVAWLVLALAACSGPPPAAREAVPLVGMTAVAEVDSAESRPHTPTPAPPATAAAPPTLTPLPPTSTPTAQPSPTVPTATATATATATSAPTSAPAAAAPATLSPATPDPLPSPTMAATATATAVAPPPAAAPPAVSPPTVGPVAPSAYETTVVINTYDYAAGFVPTAPDDAVYPYPRLDFARVGSPTARSYRAIVLQNGYVAVTILPELGGRIYKWVDKATGRELLYQNPVVKPTSWGYRGWWLAAGGIEWAFPVEEHGLNEWRPWDAVVGTSDYGMAVFVSNVDDRTGMQVGATIALDTDHAYVTIQPWARNDGATPQPYQLWLNAMVAINGNYVSGPTQFVIPAGQVTVHSTGDGALPGSGGAMGWPTHGGRDMSWYANWGGYLGFFVPPGSADYVGIYDHAVDQGIVRILGASGWPSGTKLFGPATLSPSLWTDDGSHYVELWSGATPSFNTYWTLDPGQSVGWTEFWYPLNGVSGFTYANRSAALRLVATGNGAALSVAVTRQTNGVVTLFADGAAVATWPVALTPGQAWRAEWSDSAAGGALGLRLSAENGTILAQTGSVP